MALELTAYGPAGSAGTARMKRYVASATARQLSLSLAGAKVEGKLNT